MSTSILVAMLLSTASPRPPLVFGVPGAWAVVSRDGEVIEQLSNICGKRALDLAVSPDLNSYAFIAESDAVENKLLYLCKRGETDPHLLGDPIGFHAQPHFSDDGEWVYFGHHPRKGGPPGQHDPGANAQVYRVRLDGSRPEALTDSKGCKLSPQPLGDDLILFLHLSCHGPRTIELVNTRTGALVASALDGDVTHYPDLAADKRHLLVTRQVVGATQLVEVDLKTQTSRVIWGLPADMITTRSAWGTGRNFVLFQQDHTVLKLSLGPQPAAETLLVLKGGA